MSYVVGEGVGYILTMCFVDYEIDSIFAGEIS